MGWECETDNERRARRFETKAEGFEAASKTLEEGYNTIRKKINNKTIWRMNEAMVQSTDGQARAKGVREEARGAIEGKDAYNIVPPRLVVAAMLFLLFLCQADGLGIEGVLEGVVVVVVELHLVAMELLDLRLLLLLRAISLPTALILVHCR